MRPDYTASSPVMSGYNQQHELRRLIACIEAQLGPVLFRHLTYRLSGTIAGLLPAVSPPVRRSELRQLLEVLHGHGRLHGFKIGRTLIQDQRSVMQSCP